VQIKIAYFFYIIHIIGTPQKKQYLTSTVFKEIRQNNKKLKKDDSLSNPSYRK